MNSRWRGTHSDCAAFQYWATSSKRRESPIETRLIAASASPIVAPQSYVAVTGVFQPCRYASRTRFGLDRNRFQRRK
jgi:hypothetical protein